MIGLHSYGNLRGWEQATSILVNGIEPDFAGASLRLGDQSTSLYCTWRDVDGTKHVLQITHVRWCETAHPKIILDDVAIHDFTMTYTYGVHCGREIHAHYALSGSLLGMLGNTEISVAFVASMDVDT